VDAPVPNLAGWEARLDARRKLRHRLNPNPPKIKEIEMRSITSPGSTMGTSNPIARDIQNVVSDAQELLKTVQTEGEGKLGDVKAKVQQQLESARQMLGQLQTTVQDGAKVAVDTTDAYVRGNPWRAVGVSAALGALIGFLAARR
jgi:ElaB protein